MIISCPECATKFTIADGLLGERGRKVRCFKCGHTWHQMPERSAPEAAAPLSAEPAEVPPPPRRPAQPPLMPPTATVPPSAVPLESEPVATADRTPLVQPNAGGLPMDSDLPSGAAAKSADDFDIPNVAPPDDPSALAATQSADDAETTNTVDVDALLNSKPEDIPKVFDKRIRTDEKKGKLGRVVFFLLFLAGLAATMWFGRMQIVARFPEAARLYKMVGLPIELLGDGLEFRGVTSEMVKEGKLSVLLVRGVVANVVTEERPVPLLRLVLLDTGGGVIQEAYAKPRKDTLAGGAQIGFQIRMEDPSAAAVRYEVAFAEAPAKTSAVQETGAADKPEAPPAPSAKP
jgi:predicted Zn finger-like uncharacterized protein